MGRGGFLQTYGAPRLTFGVDKYRYRQDVRKWMNKLTSMAIGGYSEAGVVASRMGLFLYANMDPKYRRILDSAMNKGDLLFEHEDCTPLSTAESIHTVELILAFVAKDKIVNVVHRLKRMVVELLKCKQQPGQSCSEYESHFCEVEAKLANYCHDSSEVEETILAVMLLENAHLPPDVYNSAVSAVASKLENTRRTSERCYYANSYTSSKLKEYVDNAVSRISTISSSGSLTMGKKERNFQMLKKCIDKQSTLISGFKKRENGREFMEGEPYLELETCTAIGRTTVKETLKSAGTSFSQEDRNNLEKVKTCMYKLSEILTDMKTIPDLIDGIEKVPFIIKREDTSDILKNLPEPSHEADNPDGGEDQRSLHSNTIQGSLSKRPKQERE